MDKNMKILIVDDFSTMRRIIKNLLRDLGFTNTVEADDGTTAIPMLNSGSIDFLVTDWNMPGMTGIDLLQDGEHEGLHEDGASAHLEPSRDLEDERFQGALADAIANLPERERLVLALYYDEELNLKEIGEVLGVSESRVSQLHSQCAARLRGRLGEWRAR